MNERKQPELSKSQADKFKQAACELGCDQDEAKFDAALRKIGQSKPPADPPKGKQDKIKK